MEYSKQVRRFALLTIQVIFRTAAVFIMQCNLFRETVGVHTSTMKHYESAEERKYST